MFVESVPLGATGKVSKHPLRGAVREPLPVGLTRRRHINAVFINKNQKTAGSARHPKLEETQ